MLKKKYLNQKNLPNATKTIICFHGILNDAFSNTPIEELAQELNYNYISYSLPMHGGNYQTQRVTVAEIIKTAIDVVKLSPTKEIILFGHSAGANWVNQCMNHYGDSHFEKVVLIAPINSSLKIVNLNKIRTFHKLLFKQKITYDKILDEFRNISVLFKNYKYGQAIEYVNLVLHFANKKFLMSTNLIYEKTKIPVMVIAGQNDMIIDTQDSQNLFHLLNPEIQYHVLGNCGHTPHFEDKQTFNHLVKEFLITN